jgi:hypothetical protein
MRSRAAASCWRVGGCQLLACRRLPAPPAAGWRPGGHSPAGSSIGLTAGRDGIQLILASMIRGMASHPKPVTASSSRTPAGRARRVIRRRAEAGAAHRQTAGAGRPWPTAPVATTRRLRGQVQLRLPRVARSRFWPGGCLAEAAAWNHKRPRHCLDSGAPGNCTRARPRESSKPEASQIRAWLPNEGRRHSRQDDDGQVCDDALRYGQVRRWSNDGDLRSRPKLAPVRPIIPLGE